MKLICLSLLLLSICLFSFSQNFQKSPVKPTLDTNAFNKWEFVKNPGISNDGKYAFYTIDNQPIQSSTLIIKSINNKWGIEVPGASVAKFLSNNRVIFLKPKDSLCIVKLGTDSVEYIVNVRFYDLFTQGNNECIVYESSTKKKECTFVNLVTYNRKCFTNVTKYLVSPDGNNILLQTETIGNDNKFQEIRWVDLINEKVSIIWRGVSSGSFAFDENSNQVAFVGQSDSHLSDAIWYYRKGSEKASILVDNNSGGLDSSLKIDKNIKGFSRDGTRLFISLKEKDFPIPNSNAVLVDVWSYTDSKLQSQQLSELNPQNWGGGPKSYVAVVNISEKTTLRLQEEDETIMFFNNNYDDVAFIINRKGNYVESNWNVSAKPSYYIISTKSGIRKVTALHIFGMSPNGKYLIGSDHEYLNYFSYNLLTDQIRNLTQNLPIPMGDDEYDRPHKPKPRGLFGIAGWLGNDSALFVYDKYDVWKIDPKGIKSPVSITNGFGRKHKIVFRISNYRSGKIFEGNEEIILTAFNKQNKENGFYSIKLSSNKDPNLLNMGPYVYDIKFGMSSCVNSEFSPIKARDTALYIIKRESTFESSNYFITSDFKNISSISSVYPERTYNWLTSQLITWKTFEGHAVQGVLFKPENFNPKNKYPLIIHYYEKKSDRKNVYQPPFASFDNINIPWFVSNGYLVFTPDVEYVIGQPGQSVYSSVISAVNYLSKMPFIDTSKIGLQGHSWGSYETNYLVTHTNVFAAAVSISGVSNFISSYGALRKHDGHPRNYIYETEQSRIGATLWERPDLYIKNSPIFYANKVTTPILLVNNEGDGSVPFSQGVEFFTALRRLGKKAWMLQYDGQDHSLWGKNATIDYTLRMTQFFDHYLKNMPAPKWMTRGIPAKLKGIDNGFEIDNKLKTPGPGLNIIQ